MQRALIGAVLLAVPQLLHAPAATSGVLLNGDLTLQIGQLPAIVVPAAPNRVTVLNPTAPHDVQIATTAWEFSEAAVATSLLTGVAALQQLTLTANVMSALLTGLYPGTANPVGGGAIPTITPNSGQICPSGCLGGTVPITGQLILNVAGVELPVPISVIGAGGVTVVNWAQAPNATLTMTGGPVVTGPVVVTGIETTRITLTNRPASGFAVTLIPTPNETIVRFTTGNGITPTNPTGVLDTQSWVILSGTNGLLSSGVGGSVTFVTPIRIHTTGLPLLLPGQESLAAQALAALDGRAGALYLRMEFIPEPGTATMLIAGSAALLVLGARRRRR